MKKTNIFKIVMTLVMAFIVTGAFAQLATDNTDFVDNTTTDYVTINKSMPYYVEPDGLYSPSFDASLSLTGDVNTTFSWTYTPPVSGSATVDTDNNNYQEVTFNELGIWTIKVEETYNAGCAGTAVTQTVEVVDTPGIAGFDFFENTLGITSGGAAYEYCGNQTTSDDINIAFNGFPNFQLDWQLDVEEIDGTGATVVNANNATLVDNTAATGTPQVLGGGNALVRAEPTGNLTIESRTFTMIQDASTNDVRTKYTYTFNGVTDNISRKSDYGKTATWYDIGGYTFEIIVNPAPETGPIYHIKNDWGNL